MLRIVCDTNTLVSGLLFNGPERRLLHEIAAGNVLLFTSPAIFEEVAEVIQRPKFKLQSNEAEPILESLRTLCEFVEPARHVQVIKDDPDDDKVLECALETDAAYIVSGDHPPLGTETIQKYGNHDDRETSRNTQTAKSVGRVAIAHAPASSPTGQPVQSLK